VGTAASIHVDEEFDLRRAFPDFSHRVDAKSEIIAENLLKSIYSRSGIPLIRPS